MSSSAIWRFGSARKELGTRPEVISLSVRSLCTATLPGLNRSTPVTGKRWPRRGAVMTLDDLAQTR
jgi:hypothetical protein